VYPTNRPRVSIVTPAYNEEPHLAECIESVLSQSYENWRYVIVDNCSTDRTGEIALDYASRDPRIEVHRNPELVGSVANHNLCFGFVDAASKYCKVVAADDRIFPDCVERMVDLAEEHPSIGVVGAYRFAGSRLPETGLPFPSRIAPGREVCRSYLLGGPHPFGVPTSLLYRADLVRAQPSFFEEGRLNADVRACLNVLERQDFGFVHAILAFERKREGSCHSYISGNNLYLAEYLGCLADFGPRYLTAEELRSCVDRAVSGYFEFLAASCFHRRGGEFWRAHREMLGELGHPIGSARLLAHAALYGLESALRRLRRKL
jgi:glycosyltransferase involved in cell wall biosynthesis